MKKIVNIFLIISIILTLMQPIIYATNDIVYQATGTNSQQEAVVETALAYLAKGQSIQYDQVGMCQYTNDSGTIIKKNGRRNLGSAPEEATRHSPLFLDCSSYVYSVYKHALGIELPSSTKNLMYEAIENKSNKNYIPVYENVSNSTDLNKLKNNFQTGDLLVFRRASGTGHVVLYLGNNKIIHSSGSDYNYSTKKDTFENNGTIRIDNIDMYFDSTNTKYLLSKDEDNNYKINNYALIRPIGLGTSNITTSANARIKYNGIVIEKTSTVPHRQTVNLSQEITYTIEITNNSNQNYKNLPVIGNIPENTTYKSNSANNSGVYQGNAVNWILTKIKPNETVNLCYTVTTTKDSAKIGEIISAKSSVGGLETNTITNTISKNLSEKEQQVLVETAYKYYIKNQQFNLVNYSTNYSIQQTEMMEIPENSTSENTINLTPAGIINAIYYQALGIDLGIASKKITEISDQVIGNPRTLGQDTVYQLLPITENNNIRKMLLADFYGGIKVETTDFSRTNHIYERNLQTGDILFYRYDDSSGSELGAILLYLGKNKLLTISKTNGVYILEGNELTSKIDSLLGQKKFAILRPSQAFTQRTITNQAQERIGNLNLEQQNLLTKVIENSTANNIKASQNTINELYKSVFNADVDFKQLLKTEDAKLSIDKSEVNEDVLQVGDIIKYNEVINLYYGPGKILQIIENQVLTSMNLNEFIEQIESSNLNINSWDIVRVSNVMQLSINGETQKEYTTEGNELHGNILNRIANRFYLNNNIEYNTQDRDLQELPENTVKTDEAGLVHSVFYQAFGYNLPSSIKGLLGVSHIKVNEIDAEKSTNLVLSKLERGDVIVYSFLDENAIQNSNALIYMGNSRIAMMTRTNGVIIQSGSAIVKQLKTDMQNENNTNKQLSVLRTELLTDKKILKVDFTLKPNKKEYIQNNEKLNLDGGKLTVTYNDYTTEVIKLPNENVKVSGFDNTKLGTNTIIVEYEGYQVTFEVKIVAKDIIGIELTTKPLKKKYIQNFEDLDLTGGVLTVSYNDNTTDTISLTNKNIKVTGFNNTKLGTNTITVKYEGYQTTFDVTIISKSITGIKLTTKPLKNKYIQNYEKLDLTGGKLTISYNDNTTDVVPLTNENVQVTGFNNTKLGTNTITVEYEGYQTTFDVTIISKGITGIELTTKPLKKKYIQNYEKLDLTGGMLTVSYNDNTTDVVPLANENVQVTGFNNTKLGTNTITVEYEGYQTTFDVTIISKGITGIELTTKPLKKKYIQNYEKLDLTGGMLTVSYNDNTTDVVSLANEGVKVSGFDNTKLGTNTITVEYEGYQTTFDVTIIPKEILNIELTTIPIKKIYIQNYENLDLSGGILTVLYNDNSTDTISLTNKNVKVSGFDNTKLGTNIIIVEYGGYRAEFTIKIVDKEVIKIEITNKPLKNKYIQNLEELDLTGGILTVLYNDNSKDTIAMTNPKLKITGFDNTKVGENIIQIEYKGIKTTFTVGIIEVVTNENIDNTIADKEMPAAGIYKISIVQIICICLIILKIICNKIKKYNFK